MVKYNLRLMGSGHISGRLTAHDIDTHVSDVDRTARVL